MELAHLLAVLAVRLGPINRVLSKVGDWANAPTELVTADGAVQTRRMPASASQHHRSPRAGFGTKVLDLDEDDRRNGVVR